MVADPRTDLTSNVGSSPPTPTSSGTQRGWLARWFTIQDQIPSWEAVALGAVAVFACWLLWWFVTLGPAEERILSPLALSSPGETFAKLPVLITGNEAIDYSQSDEGVVRTWPQFFEQARSEQGLLKNLFVTLRRLLLGFALATMVGVPLGVLCGCFSRIQAFFLPLSIFGRNIPLAALVGLTFSLFGIGELQKVMFIFLACVAFILSDTDQAIRSVGSQYIDTALTLGARPWQVIFKVLVPLSLPRVCNSLRLLFGLAFGYIMLAETIKFGNEAGGLGNIINTAMRREPRENVLLVLLLIPVVALAIDRVLLLIQRELFPHVHGGHGRLNRLVRWLLQRGEDLKRKVFPYRPMSASSPLVPPPS